MSFLRAGLRRIAVVACVLVGGAARGDDAPLAVRARPAAVVLGGGARATIEVDAPGGPPALATNVGRVEDVREVGPGRYTAEYVAPTEAYPQVAIVSAVSGGRAAWVAVALVGRGVAVARSRPGARIRVTIGEAAFGPVRAGASGEAHVPVLVPPGVRFAYHRDRPLDLQIPESVHVQLALGASEAPADRDAEVPIWAFAVSPEGSPRAAAPLDVEVTHGSIVGLAEVAPGTFAATWRLPAGRAGLATATARLADEPAPAHVVGIARPAGAPARLAVATARPRLASGEEEALRIDVTDAAANPVDVEPRVSASFGTVRDLRRTGPGAWEAKLEIPRELGGVERVEVVAHAAGIEERFALPIEAGAAARLVVAAERDVLVADGEAEARVRVEVRDAFGNRVDGPPPEVATTLRAAVSTERGVDGAWVVRYRPARARENATDAVAVRAGGMQATAKIRVAAPERRLSIAPKVGFTASLAGARSAYLGAESALQAPLWRGRVGVALELGTFVHDRTDVVPAGDGTLEIHGRARYVALLASARWREPLGARWALLADGGIGLAHVGAEVSAGAAPSSGEEGVVGALHTGVGLGFRLGPGAAFLETRAARFRDPALETLRGALTTVTFVCGYRYDAY